MTEKPGKRATEVRQAELVEAALALAAQRSPADISTGDLARVVGISQGAVFRHFCSKESIWLATMDWIEATLLSQLQAAAAGQPGLAALQSVFLAHVDFVVTHPGVPRVIFHELQRPGGSALKDRVHTLMQGYRSLLVALLQQAKTEASIAPDTDVAAAAVLFIGSIQGLVMQSMISGSVTSMSTQAPGVFAIFRRGLLADTGTPF